MKNYKAIYINMNESGNVQLIIVLDCGFANSRQELDISRKLFIRVCA